MDGEESIAVEVPAEQESEAAAAALDFGSLTLSDLNSDELKPPPKAERPKAARRRRDDKKRGSNKEHYRSTPSPHTLAYADWVAMREETFDREFEPFKAGVDAGQLCSCSLCGPWALWAEKMVPAYSPAQLCDCKVCGGSGLRLGMCVCPVCTPWTRHNGGDQQPPVVGALEQLNNSSAHVPQSVSYDMDKRKAEQFRLQGRVLSIGDSAVGLLKYVIRRARKDPHCLKTGVRAAIDTLRLSLPQGWDKDQDPHATERVLGEFRSTMKEMGKLMQLRIEAAEKGIEIPQYEIAITSTIPQGNGNGKKEKP